MTFHLMCTLIAAKLTWAQTTVVELQSVTTSPYYLKTTTSASFTLASTEVAVPAVPLATTVTVSQLESVSTSNSPTRSTWTYIPSSDASQASQSSGQFSLILSGATTQALVSTMTTTFNALSVLSCAIATFDSGVTAPCVPSATSTNSMATGADQNTVTLTALTQVTDIATAPPSTTLAIISASNSQDQGVTVVVLPGQATSTAQNTATQLVTSTALIGNPSAASSTTQITDGFAGLSSNTALSTATTLVTSTSVSTVTTGLGGIIGGSSGSSSRATQISNMTPSGSSGTASSGTASSNRASSGSASGATSNTASSSTRTTNTAGIASSGSSTATRTSTATVTTSPSSGNTAASTTAVRSATITPAPIASQGPYAGSASNISTSHILGVLAAALFGLLAQ